MWIWCFDQDPIGLFMGVLLGLSSSEHKDCHDLHRCAAMFLNTYFGFCFGASHRCTRRSVTWIGGFDSGWPQWARRWCRVCMLAVALASVVQDFHFHRGYCLLLS